MSDTLRDTRREYHGAPLLLSDTPATPFPLFESWLNAAKNNDQILDATAMTLATANENALPSTRIVLLKDIINEQCVFYTHYDSPKAMELKHNPQACINFYWPEHMQQISIQGSIEKITPAASKEYFYSRPKASQVAALTATQSSIVDDRDALEARYNALSETYQTAAIPFPNNWGGYALTPSAFIFWQGRGMRLHDRIRYKKENTTWVKERLAP